MKLRSAHRLGGVVAALLIVGCGGSTPVSPASAPASTPPPVSTLVPTAALTGWAADLAQLDQEVRRFHPSPFTIHPEAEWTARLAEIAKTIEDASREEQLVKLSSLVGLLDTHTAMFAMPGGWHFYDVIPYRFSDGWFIVQAGDPSLIGAQLLAIGDTPIQDVEARLSDLVPHDNESGRLENLEWALGSVEYLQGTGITTPEHPRFELRARDGTTSEVSPKVVDESTWGSELVPIGWLQGAAPEAVARRDERIWTRLDRERDVFLVSVNDYGDMTAAIAAMTAALDAGDADRVVLDMRYLRGGNGDIKLVEALAADERTAAQGGLIVLIGRENVSAGTVTAAALDRDTEGIFVGEATPARADNFLCECRQITLANSGFVIEIPTFWFRTGDDRSAIEPDVPMPLSSEQFFAGNDPVLDAALNGDLSAPSS